MEKPMSSVLGTGWAFPVDLSAGRFRLVSDEQRVRQSLELVLTTAAGERLMLPSFGCGVHDLVFQPNTPGIRASVAAEVRAAILRWEPRVDVIDVAVTADPDEPAVMWIRVDYRLRTVNTVYNLVYPLYLTEGVAGGLGRGSVLDAR
jgi:phage baseplate assembly protein W